MLIKDLSKKLDTKTMTALRGGGLNGSSNATSDLFEMFAPTSIGLVNGPGSASNNFINVAPSQSTTNSTGQETGDPVSIALGDLGGVLRGLKGL
jgi:hypothetical protein